MEGHDVCIGGIEEESTAPLILSVDKRLEYPLNAGLF